MMPLVLPESLPPKSDINMAGPIVNFPYFERDRRTVAFHEAGHIILSILGCIPVKYAFINDLPSSHDIHADQLATYTPGGKVIPDFDLANNDELTRDDPAIDCSIEIAHRWASMYMAGYQAELLLHGLDVSGRLDMDVPDYINAKKLLQLFIGHDNGIHYHERYARSMLTHFWPLVMSIAGELWAKGVINSMRISEILHSEARHAQHQY